jgi:hypothetical protein
MQIADERISYNQEDMKILDETNKEIAIRTWYGVMEGIEDFENPMQFGSYGYYTDWNIED